MKKSAYLSTHVIYWLILNLSVCSNGNDNPQTSTSKPNTTIFGDSNLKVPEKEIRVMPELEKSDNQYTNSAEYLHSSFEDNVQENIVIDQVLYIESPSHNIGISTELLKGDQSVLLSLKEANKEVLKDAEKKSQKDLDSLIPNVTKSDLKNTITPNLTEFKAVNILEPDKPELPVIKQTSQNLSFDGEVQEEIPSFSEWTQKQLEEAEKKKQDNAPFPQNVSGKTSSNSKLRSKNYASPDCGAKIVATNPEAVSPSSILSPLRDEYKLNACTNRIWFIVELCEAIQAKRIDLANFELFSSSPKDFTVSLSDRFPSRDWSLVGQFTAKDERDIQSFDLSPHLFGRYIKVEIKSHYGSEHFCPISLFRVYGTSEFEVLEKEEQVNSGADDDDDDALDAGDSESSKNLLSSATDAVISIVKKAAEVLGNKGNNSNQTVRELNTTEANISSTSTCITPIHQIICDNCTGEHFEEIYTLISCRYQQLLKILAIPYIKDTLLNSNVCNRFGLKLDARHVHERRFVEFVFSRKYIGALCNLIAVMEHLAKVNVSGENAQSNENVVYSNVSQSVNLESLETVVREEQSNLPFTGVINEEPVDVKTPVPSANATDFNASDIKPTQTETTEEVVSVSTKDHKEVVQDTNIPVTSSVLLNSSEESGDKVFSSEVENIGEYENASESLESADEQFDMGDVSIESSQAANTQQMVTPGVVQKESVFLRLSNRIKALERNMSLSSQYLEELSRRYKKQVEEIQRTLDKALSVLHKESKRNEDLELQIKELKATLDALIFEKSSWMHFMYWPCFILIIVLTIASFCLRVTSNVQSSIKNSNSTEAVRQIRRRKSIDVVNRSRKYKRKRRPSEETLCMTGNYEHLLIAETKNNFVNRKNIKAHHKRRLIRSNSATVLNNPFSINSNFQPGKSGNSAFDWVESNVIQIQEPPLVLDESENSILEPLDYTYECADVENIDSSLTIRAASEYLHNGDKSSSQKVGSGSKIGHKKSASVGGENGNVEINVNGNSSASISLNGSFEEEKPGKKEKKSGLKRILKKVF